MAKWPPNVLRFYSIIRIVMNPHLNWHLFSSLFDKLSENIFLKSRPMTDWKEPEKRCVHGGLNERTV